MLLDIKQYLIERQHASLRDIALHFDTNPDAMRGMLEIWINKGKIRKCDAAACGGCSSGCEVAKQDEAYESTERRIQVTPVVFHSR
ncbi:MAG: FeoC-like transcriptional regulator [Granulosicoccus sp.]